MFVLPRFRGWAAKDPGISFILTGSEITSNPDIEVVMKTADKSFTLTVTEKMVANDVMFVHAKPPDGHFNLDLAAGDDGGVGSITVTVVGVGSSITADAGFGGPPPPTPAPPTARPPAPPTAK